MLSTSSLQAFSGAATTASINTAGRANPVRLVRAQQEQAARPPSGSAAAMPERPALPLPRGSLLNLSV